MVSGKNDAIFKQLSGESRNCMKAGDLQGYALALERMAAVHAEEGSADDELKLWLIVFYIRLSGFRREAHIDTAVVNRIRLLVAGKSRFDVDELYLSAIRDDVTPTHIMTVHDSLFLLWLCIDRKFDEANAIIDRC